MEESKTFDSTSGLNVRICITYAVLTVVFLGVFRPSFLEGNVGICFRVTCLLIGMIFFVFNMKIRKMINMSLIYVLPVSFSCLYNYMYKGLDFSNMINGLQYALCIYEMYTMFQYCNQNRGFMQSMRAILSAFSCNRFYIRKIVFVF